MGDACGGVCCWWGQCSCGEGRSGWEVSCVKLERPDEIQGLQEGCY